MTEIHLHGILAHKYGKIHKLAIQKPKDFFLAMEANHDNFICDLKNLAKKNIYYSCVTDNRWLKGEDLNLKCRKIKKLDFVPIVGGAGALIGQLIITVGLQYLGNYLSNSKMEYPKIPRAQAATSANNRSLAFSNRENITEQGNPVPLVYGRLKIGSAVIQSSIKSFPLSITLSQEFQNTASRNSGNQNAIIENSSTDDTQN
ncbi:MAG: hypothetical protein ACO3GY_07135 [Flavobacteriaceae bacterium]